MSRFLEILSYVVAAAATTVLAIYAYVQTKALNQEKEKRAAQLDAIAKRHAMLVRRSLRECVRTLDENDPSKGDGVWTNAMNRASQALGGPVQADLHKMLDAAIERRGGTGENIEEILDRYYSACDSFNELAARGGHMDPEAMKKHRDNARKNCIQCWGAIEREFGFETQQPHSFGKTPQNPSLGPGLPA